MIAAPLVAALGARGLTVATAESLTGGLVAAALTQVPGASAVVRGGVVGYAADVKIDVLGVDSRVVTEYGTVSRECALAMAAGAAHVCSADLGLATTGVAGPDPSEGQPVGTVHVAVVGPGERQAHLRLALSGGRDDIRAETVQAVLDLALRTLDAAADAEADPT